MLELSRLSDRLDDAGTYGITERKQAISALSSLLNSYNPLGVLQRGYSVAYDINGKIVTKKNQINIGDGFSLLLADGKIQAVRTGDDNGKEKL